MNGLLTQEKFIPLAMIRGSIRFCHHYYIIWKIATLQCMRSGLFIFWPEIDILHLIALETWRNIRETIETKLYGVYAEKMKVSVRY